jgi:hypothetical protein
MRLGSDTQVQSAGKQQVHAKLSPWMARGVLAGLLLLLLSGLAIRVPPQPAGSSKDQGDAALFRTVARRMQNGEPYYPAMGNELRRRGYPTASVFNWRTPLILQTVAAAPRAAAICLLALGGLAILATVILLLQAMPEALLLSLLLQVGATASIVLISDSVTVPEIWTGYLVIASLAAYARGWPIGGAALGLLALFVRELAAPYCLVCGVMAFGRRRWLEAAFWALGACAYAAYFISHASNVAAHTGPGDVAHAQSWVQFGGLAFVLGTISFTGWFVALQPWGAAVGCVLIVASMWARKAPLHLRVTVVTYLALFSIVGQVFNQNWGLVTAPAWALACGYGVEGVRTLIVAARSRDTRSNV